MDTQTRTAKLLSQSLRSGQHATVYEIRRDPELKNKNVIKDNSKGVFPFIQGSHYKGQWEGDMKDGFGIQFNPDNTKYEGEWKANKYDGRGTLWVKKIKKYQRQYVGDWSEGQMEGQGIYYFENGEIYRGGWLKGKKSGTGRLDYLNGDNYNGEWVNDLQNGFGTMNYTNGNTYEGLWSQGMKEGPGLFYYASTKKIYQGEWFEDQPRCGEFRSPNAEEELRFVRPPPKGVFHNPFSLPELALKNPRNVMELAISEVRIESLNKSLTKPDGERLTLDPADLQRAKFIFTKLSGEESSTISIYSLAEVFKHLGLDLHEKDINEIIQQLELTESLEVSFAEVVEIAAFVHGQKKNQIAPIVPY